jgi:hypothetical protein
MRKVMKHKLLLISQTHLFSGLSRAAFNVIEGVLTYSRNL